MVQAMILDAVASLGGLEWMVLGGCVVVVLLPRLRPGRWRIRVDIEGERE